MAHNVDQYKTSVNDAILDYSCGNLTPARQVILACQRELSETLDREISFHESIAASTMMQNDVALSEDFFDRFEARLSEEASANEGFEDIQVIEDNNAPVMRQFLSKRYLSEIKWQSLVPGVAIHNIIGGRGTNDHERLYLLRAKGGMKMPVHSHNGEEWTLILTGSYDAEGVTYKRGDLHISNDNDEHAPHIAEGEACICLVMTEAPLTMKSFVPRLLQPLIGI